MKCKILACIIGVLLFAPAFACALDINQDSDRDGLSDAEEVEIYRTNTNLPDTDNDGYPDGEEVRFGFDPNQSINDRLEKRIDVSLKDQSLAYSLGPYVLKTILISTGTAKFSTPAGDFKILVKKPLVTYKGSNYFYPNTRWNMMFLQKSSGNLYIHGAYWHNNFGNKMSHGCVNVSYPDMEALYKWADAGIKVFID